MREAASRVGLDFERQAKAKEYARIRRRLMLVDLGMGAAYLLAWLVSGGYLAVGDRMETLTTVPALEALLFGVIFALPYVLLGLPLAYYRSFWLPHRYGQSNQAFAHWMGDQFKRLTIIGVLGGVAAEVVYWLLRATPEWWWLYAGGLGLLFMVGLATLYPVLIMPLFFKFTPLEDEDLAARLTRLAERAGTNVKGVFRFDMSRRAKNANAELTGMGATRRIVLSDTLLDEFTPDEIEIALAHELGHHVHHDVLLGVALYSVLALAGFFAAHVVLAGSVETFGLDGMADPAGMPVLALVGGATGLMTMLLTNAYWRWRERMADRYALQATHNAAAFASMMTRLANQNLADADPERWVVLLLYSHPPIRERLAMAEAWGEK